MFYNILPPTISVKDLKNKENTNRPSWKVQFSSSKTHVATESALFYILCKMPTNVLLYDEKEIFCFFPFILSFWSFHFDRSYQAAGLSVSPILRLWVPRSRNPQIYSSFLPLSLHASFHSSVFPFFAHLCSIAVRTFLLLSHGGAFLVFYVRLPELFAFGRLFSFKSPAFFIHYSLFGWQTNNVKLD